MVFVLEKELVGFPRLEDGKGYRAKVKFIPMIIKKLKVKATDVMSF